jgi:hypothetical protein
MRSAFCCPISQDFRSPNFLTQKVLCHRSNVPGFMLTVVQFMLSLLGACAYNADETIYPELDEDPRHNALVSGLTTGQLFPKILRKTYVLLYCCVRGRWKVIENDAESATLCKAPATDIHTHTYSHPFTPIHIRFGWAILEMDLLWSLCQGSGYSA